MLTRTRTLLISALALTLGASPLHAAEVARRNLNILGVFLGIETPHVDAAVDVPVSIQTSFGGKINGDVPADLTAVGELTGPGIDIPITLTTTPGRAFSVPPLRERGEYTLHNIRLLGPGGVFLQQAIPSFATIRVVNALQTEVTVRQLTPDELRQRGITIDSRNFDYYERRARVG